MIKDNRGTADFVLDKPSGYLKVATIDHVDLSTNTAWVKLRDRSFGSAQVVPAQLPVSYLSSGGGFIGGMPAGGTPVIIGQAEGSNAYFIVQFIIQDPAPQNTTRPALIPIPPLALGQISIQATPNQSITLNQTAITIGNYDNSLVLDYGRNTFINTYDNSYELSEASRLIEGTVKRDRTPSSTLPDSLRVSDASFDDSLTVIGMDPLYSTGNSNLGNAIRNPARTEKHEIVYESEQFGSVQTNTTELANYGLNTLSNTLNVAPAAINRRESRADALSLSLVSPNYLMETIKGTVVDVFGNLLDINRNIIPIGQTPSLSATTIKSSASQPTFTNTYEQIKRFERKSLAYHFEINARKETGGTGVPSVTDFSDYARLRSRFHFDIDKEGVFKLNVPASSEVGNIPLLTRYENYSTVSPDMSSGTPNPNSLIFNENYTDVLIESFINTSNTGQGAPIQLVDDLGNPSGPLDRFYGFGHQQYVGHGTAYHDISQTCISFQNTYTGKANPTAEYYPVTNIALGRIPQLPRIVNQTIITAGSNANAGGRSGQMNFDGSIEVNVGANTVDKQSLWLDTEGGIVAAVGQDIQGISLAGKLDGQVLLEIGGSSTIPLNSDPRFKGQTTSLVAGVLDIRVYDGQGSLTMLRIDKEGLTVSTPSRMVISSNQDVLIRSNATMSLEAETLYVQGRKVVKDTHKPII